MILDPLDWLREVLTARDDVRSVEVEGRWLRVLTTDGQEVRCAANFAGWQSLWDASGLEDDA